jgi:hypothetical protein
VTTTKGDNSNTGSIRIDNISGCLSKDTIDKMILDAEKYRNFDDDRMLCAAVEELVFHPFWNRCHFENL